MWDVLIIGGNNVPPYKQYDIVLEYLIVKQQRIYCKRIL